MTGLAACVAAVVGFVSTAIIGKFLIPFLRKMHFGQTILDDIGPSWHKQKQGTPTMGGFMFMIGSLLGIMLGLAFLKDGLIWAQLWRVVAGFVMALGFSAIGFLDDYIGVVKKRNLGLTEIQKMILQAAIAATYLLTLYLLGDRSTILVIPFLGQWDIGMWYYPLMIFFIVGFVNAVNITDGIDGLSSSVTFICATGLMLASSILSLWVNSVFAAALAGSLIGYLIYNFYPAKVFMGDTGSMFMGGCVIAMCFNLGAPFLMFICGIVYFIEVFSVMLQIFTIKVFHKKVFKMSPIHHHFEMSGWREVKIVGVFSLVTLIAAGFTVLAVMNF